jgi:hypothetical protein
MCVKDRTEVCQSASVDFIRIAAFQTPRYKCWRTKTRMCHIFKLPHIGSDLNTYMHAYIHTYMYTHAHARIHCQNVLKAFCIMLFTNVYNEYIASRVLTFTNKQNKTNKHAHTLYVCTTYVYGYVTRLVAFKYVYFTHLAVYRNIYQNGNVLNVSDKITELTDM